MNSVKNINEKAGRGKRLFLIVLRNVLYFAPVLILAELWVFGSSGPFAAYERYKTNVAVTEKEGFTPCGICGIPESRGGSNRCEDHSSTTRSLSDVIGVSAFFMFAVIIVMAFIILGCFESLIHNQPLYKDDLLLLTLLACGAGIGFILCVFTGPDCPLRQAFSTTPEVDQFIFRWILISALAIYYGPCLAKGTLFYRCSGNFFIKTIKTLWVYVACSFTVLVATLIIMLISAIIIPCIINITESLSSDAADVVSREYGSGLSRSFPMAIAGLIFICVFTVCASFALFVAPFMVSYYIFTKIEQSDRCPD